MRSVMTRWTVVVAGAALLAGAARATTGGAQIMEVLGWDPGDREIYVAQHYRGDSGYPPAIVSIDLESPEPRHVSVVPWSVNANLAPGEYSRRAGVLRARLKPLPPTPAASMFERTRIVAKDTVEVGGAPWPRYRVQATRLRLDWDGTLEVLTYNDPSVRVLSLHPIPERTERLAIVSFLGIPSEGGNECQVPVVLPARADTVRVQCRPFRQ